MRRWSSVSLIHCLWCSTTKYTGIFSLCSPRVAVVSFPSGYSGSIEIVMASKKFEKTQLPSKESVSANGKIVKNQQKDTRVLSKSRLPEWIEKFDHETLLKLGMKDGDIHDCISLPRRELIVRILKEKSKNFDKIKYLFEDIPENSFSGAREDLNDWTLREAVMLLSSMDRNRVMKPRDWDGGIPWESIDSPKEGAEETWKSLTSKLPNTMEHVCKRVKTLVVTRCIRPRKLYVLPANTLWNRVPAMCNEIRKELDSGASEPVNLHSRNVLEVLSPLGRTIINVKAMDEVTSCNRGIKDRGKLFKDMWKFPSI